MAAALTEAQIREIESANTDGLTSQDLVRVFEDRQVSFSEANLRRYVQLGMVPRSRRIGSGNRPDRWHIARIESRPRSTAKRDCHKVLRKRPTV